MNNCDGCKHWKRNVRSFADQDDYIRESWGRHFPEQVEPRLAKVAELDHWGDCAMMVGPTFEERVPGTLAFAEDGSSYAAGVVTREDFGCVMFMPKTDGELVR
jgi:hypothetical protein